MVEVHASKMKPSPSRADFPACILIVDDERHNRELLEVMLKPEGFILLSAATGEEALTIVARQPPDLILLDVMMPGMSGYEVVERIKSDPDAKSIPVIMLTALDDRNARTERWRRGFSHQAGRPSRAVGARQEPAADEVIQRQAAGNTRIAGVRQ